MISKQQPSLQMKYNTLVPSTFVTSTPCLTSAVIPYWPSTTRPLNLQLANNKPGDLGMTVYRPPLPSSEPPSMPTKEVTWSSTFITAAVRYVRLHIFPRTMYVTLIGSELNILCTYQLPQ